MKQEPPKPPPTGWQEIGLATSIPTLLAAGPLVGYVLGRLIQRWTGWGQWVVFVCLAIGFATGVHETIKIIRKLP